MTDVFSRSYGNAAAKDISERLILLNAIRRDARCVGVLSGLMRSTAQTLAPLIWLYPYGMYYASNLFDFS